MWPRGPTLADASSLVWSAVVFIAGQTLQLPITVVVQLLLSQHKPELLVGLQQLLGPDLQVPLHVLCRADASLPGELCYYYNLSFNILMALGSSNSTLKLL